VNEANAYCLIPQDKHTMQKLIQIMADAYLSVHTAA